MEANEYQIGGSHYSKHEYQHWDFVCGSNIHYLLGCATKYISRWRDKDGIKDLKKASHYTVKAMDLNIDSGALLKHHDYIIRFTKQLYPEDAKIVLSICRSEYQLALNLISDLIIQHIPVDKV